jgi:hypothetical protein
MSKTITVLPVAFVIAALIFIVLAVFLAFRSDSEVRGQVVIVEPASVTTISSLTIREDSGKLWTFVGAGTFSGFTPSHLNEHMALQEEVTVMYEELEPGVLTILSIAD